jgi:hypothetical protein
MKKKKTHLGPKRRISCCLGPLSLLLPSLSSSVPSEHIKVSIMSKRNKKEQKEHTWGPNNGVTIVWVLSCQLGAKMVVGGRKHGLYIRIHQLKEKKTPKNIF